MNQDTDISNARELIDVLAAQGVKTFFISPGSRNTPLLTALSARDRLRKHIINDERMSGFAALGYSLVRREPTALICTSGTALYNYAPAIAEAYYQHIPLIVISADRPAQWIDQDDSQTLRQNGALRNIVKRSYDVHCDAGATSECRNAEFGSEKEWYVNRTANEAFLTATTGIPGPVHINMQFANPLNGLREYGERRPRLVRCIASDKRLARKELEELAEEARDKRILVVAGFMQPDAALNKAISRFAALPNVAVICETISNLHLQGKPYMADSLLSHLSDGDKERLCPDIVITVGGALVSRMLKEFIRKSARTQHWTLADTDVSVDCMQRLTLHIEASPAAFFSGMAGALRKALTAKAERGSLAVTYAEDVEKMKRTAYASGRARINGAPWSELKALDRIFSRIPSSYNLFLSNGTCVRYAQLLMTRLPHACYCNRGVSGIDGTNATALGGAIAYKGTTLLITGDMSFAYCPEVMQMRSLGGDLRIIVMNNSGGGIFRFIPTTRDLSIREEYFCSDPELPVEKLAEAYGWTYLRATNEKELDTALSRFAATPASLLEIKVDKDISARTLIDYFTPVS